MELGADPLSESDIGSIEECETVIRRVGGCMSMEDQNNVRAFVKEFSNRLLSHLEAVLRKINDSVRNPYLIHGVHCIQLCSTSEFVRF